MKKLSLKGRLVWMLGHVGAQVGDLKLIDAVYEIENEMERESVSFDVALWHWWRRNMQAGYPLEPLRCQRQLCGNEFLVWDNRSRKYCSNQCKQAEENARWYANHSENRKAQVVAWRNWSKVRPVREIPDPTIEVLERIVAALVPFGASDDEDAIRRVWAWMFIQGIEDAGCAVAELCGF